jgi:PAS domain S-box-containing protein
VDAEVYDHERLDSSLLRAMLKGTADGILAIDEQGKAVMINPAAERLFGYRANEVIGRNVSLLMPEPYRSSHDAYLRRYLETGEETIIGLGREVQGLRKDGATFPFYLSVSEVRHGRRRLFVGVVRDLSEIKRAEEALQAQTRSLELLKRIAVAANEASTLDDAMQACLDAVCAYTDWPVGHAYVAADGDGGVLIPTRLWHLEDAERYAGFRRAAEATRLSRGVGLPGRAWLTGKPAWTSDMRRDPNFPRSQMAEDIRVKAGFAFPVLMGKEVVAVLEFFSKKTVEPDQGLMDIMANIGTQLGRVAERRRATREVQRMRTFLQNIVDSMPSILVGVDPGGYVSEWNQQAERVTGVRASDAMGHCFVELFPQLTSQIDAVSEAIYEGHTVCTERLVTEQTGAKKYLNVVVYPLVDGTTQGAVIRVDDITRRVQIEKMMVQTEKMMSVGGLAAGMAHEINSPLSAILQSCQNTLRRLSPELAANRQAAENWGLELVALRGYLEARGILGFLENIREAAQRASRIVADMLAFGRHGAAELTPVRLDESLDAVLRLAASDYNLKKNYDFREFDIVRDYDPELPEVYCDRTAIEQVFLNVIRNAGQAMAGANTARPHRITLRTRRERGFARVELEDNGSGMDEQTRRRVFEPFFTTKPAGVGTGLGLSVSYFIVTEQHAGQMEVLSRSGEGACFVIRLPLGKQAPGSGHKA